MLTCIGASLAGSHLIKWLHVRLYWHNSPTVDVSIVILVLYIRVVKYTLCDVMSACKTSALLRFVALDLRIVFIFRF